MARYDFRDKYGIKRASELEPAKYLRTGFIRIDDARSEIGRLGLRCGSTTVIYGQTGAGKSTLTYQMVANMQRELVTTKPWLVVDIENSFDPSYAQALGVDLEQVDVLQLQEWMDHTLEGVRQAILTEAYSGIIVDSIHGQATNRDDKSIDEERSVGALPMKLTQFIQATKTAVSKSGVIMILIGQARDNMDKYGDAIHLTGGNALKHDADMILQMTRSDARSTCEGIIPMNAQTEKYDGHMARIKVEKCRGRGMGKRYMMPFINGEGFSEYRCLIEECAATEWGLKIFDTTGHHYKWEDKDGRIQKLTGKAKLMEYFSTNADELSRLQVAVLQATSADGNQPTEIISEPVTTIPTGDDGQISGRNE